MKADPHCLLQEDRPMSANVTDVNKDHCAHGG